MGAPPGNQFWKNRSKHGRDVIFESPELLWEQSCLYFQWCDDNPMMETQVVKGPWTEEKNGEKIKHNHSLVEVPKLRAYLLSGLCLFLGVNTGYFTDFKKRINSNEDESKTKLYEDFSRVITRIEDVIYTQKFEGAASGFFNANLISTELGLKTRIDHTTNDNEISGFDVEIVR